MSKGKKKSAGKIEQAFIKCLENKPLEKITVKEVCEMAGINRTTFYDSYKSLSDLLFTLQLEYFMDIYDGFFADYSPADVIASDHRLEINRRVVKYHSEHSDYLLLLLKNNSSGIFETNISRILKTLMLPEGYGRLEEYEFIYNFTGNLAAVLSWLLDGKPVSEEEFARLLSGM